MKNRDKKIVLTLVLIGIVLPLQGMRKLFQTKLAEGFQQTKQITVPKGFEPHKKFLTEPWQFSNSAWRKDVLGPTLGSAMQTAVFGSLSYAVGIPIFIIRLDRIANGLKNLWQYGHNYFAPSTQDSVQLPDKNVSESDLPKK